MKTYPTAAWARFDPRGVIWSVALFDAARVHLGDEDTVVGDGTDREKRLVVHETLRLRGINAGEVNGWEMNAEGYFLLPVTPID